MTECHHAREMPEINMEGYDFGYAVCRDCGAESDFTIDYDGWKKPSDD